MSHTEGPWRVIHHGGDSFGVQMGRIGGFMLDAHSNPKDNAQLIAAAPDLYEAARHAAMEWRLHGQLTDSCRVLEAAILKAQGKQPKAEGQS